MDSADFHPDETPVHEVEVGDFWMARIPVTNRKFVPFLEEIG